MNRTTVTALAVFLAATALFSCRGQRSGEPAIHLNPNMDKQARFNPQTGDWGLPDGTVPRSKVGFENEVLDLTSPAVTGLAGGVPVAKSPVATTSNVIHRGRERFNIHCSVCHGLDGLGQTPMLSRGLPPPTPLNQGRVVAMKDGDLFQVITHGARNMGPLGQQIRPEDRWAIVAWVRVLQSREGGTPQEMGSRLSTLQAKP